MLFGLIIMCKFWITGFFLILKCLQINREKKFKQSIEKLYVCDKLNLYKK